VATPDDTGNPRSGLLDRLIRAYQALTGRADRPDIPPPPDPAEYEPDMSPATPEERARAEAAAREAMRRLRADDD
jgi:hypothetical protein